MGNRAKRKEVARLLKEQGLGPLYKGNKKVAWVMLRAGSLDALRHKLQFKPGTMVHDCDAFNHCIVKWLPRVRSFSQWLRGGHGWVASLDQFENEEGRWSCGCPYSPDPARSREDIEKFMLGYVTDKDLGEGGWITPWHIRVRETLQSGGHICDEQGMLLPEFKRG